MIMYLAGNTGHGKAGEVLETFIQENKFPRLFSYFWIKDGGEFPDMFNRWRKELKEV